MPAATGRRIAHLAVTVALALLVAGCGSQTNGSTAASEPTTSTLAPTTTAPPPLTAKELAWLKAIPKTSTRIDKALTEPENVSLTLSKMLAYANALRGCTRELARKAPPSERLQPAYVLVKKACREYDKGAVCFTTSASLGYTYAGTPQSRKQDKAIQCGFAAQGKGAVLLADAENKGAEIKAEIG